jgi:hypothetical protein
MAKRANRVSRARSRAGSLPWEDIVRIGRDRWNALTPAEKRRIKAIARKSKGNPTGLTAKEREDGRRILLKLVGFGD